MQLYIVLLAISCLLVQGQQQISSLCSYSDPSGYNLNWNVANGIVNFNFTYNNFPANSASGVAFGDNLNAGLDVILVQLNGFQVQVVDATMVGMNSPKADSPSQVQTASSSYQNNVVRAQFSRPLIGKNAGQTNLTDCVLWSFLVNPVQLQNGQITRQPDTSKQMQVCNIEYMCQGNSAQMNNVGGFNQGVNPVLYNPPMNQNQPSQWNQPQGYNQPNNNFNGQYQQAGFNNPQYQPINNQPQQNQNQYAGGFNNQQYQPSSQFSNQYQQQNRMYDSSTQNPLGQGVNYGYNKNTATPPPLQPYTGAPFVYSTTMNPSGQNGQYQNSQQFQNQGLQGNNIMYDARNQNGYAQSQNNYQYQPQTSTQSPWNTNANNNSSFVSSAYNSVTRFFNPNQNQNQNQNAQNNQYSNQYQNQNYQNQQNQAYYNPQQQVPYGTNQPLYYNAQPNGYQQNNNMRQGYFRFKRSADRAKRQTQGYQPTNNIYGYNYDSSAQSSGNIPLVVNPNYKYLSGPAAEEYSRNYASAALQYDATTGTVPGQQNPNQMNLNGNSPILSNQQQNQVNYQQIQRDYSQNPNPNAGQTYTNNIYGYDYSSGSSVNSNQQFYQPTNYVSSSTMSPLNNNNVYLQRDPSDLYYAANPSSTTASPFVNVQRDPNIQQNQGNYQSQSDLKQTVLRDSSQRPQPNLVLRDQPTNQQSGTVYSYDAGSKMYYPYRTSTNFNPVTANLNSVNGASSSNVNTLLYDPTTRRMNDGSDPCQLEDPYWCADYVNTYLNSATQLNNQPKQTACTNMIASLAESYNGCCATVRNAGCN